jgi:hypothetical protein
MRLDLSVVFRHHITLTIGDNGQKVRIISIPKFSETSEIVVVNLSTLESEVIRFSSGTIKKEIENMNETPDVVMDDIEEL